MTRSSGFVFTYGKGDKTVAEEYCWAITQAAGRSCCGRSGSSVLEFGYQLDCLVCTAARLNWAIQFLTVAYDGACAPNVSAEWRNFLRHLSLQEKKKTWWQLASPCCWNRARRLTCFISATVTRKDMRFGTWTDPSFQRHYRLSTIPDDGVTVTPKHVGAVLM